MWRAGDPGKAGYVVVMCRVVPARTAYFLSVVPGCLRAGSEEQQRYVCREHGRMLTQEVRRIGGSGPFI